MTHYEVLGVRPDASGAEIRRAYLAAARVAHPDTATGSEERMRDLNAAFGVLSDAGRRAAYDRTLGDRIAGGAGGAGSGPGEPTIRRPDATFVPHRAYAGLEDDDPADLEDVGDPATATPLAAQVLPALLVLGAVAVGSAGLAMGQLPLVVMAVGLAVLAAVSFVVVPLLAMGRAAASERRADARRGGRS